MNAAQVVSGQNLVRNQSMQDYLDAPGISASAIKHGVTSMLHMHHAITSKLDDSTPATEWGELVHEVIAYGLDRIAAYPGKTRAGKAYEAFCSEHPGKMVVCENHFAKLERIRDAIASNADVQQMTQTGEREVSCYWDDPEYGKCKARFDFIGAMYMIDWKTTGDITLRRFEKTAFDMGYHIKVSWYMRAARAAGRNPTPCIVSIEADEPYDVVPYMIDEAAIEYGDEVCDRIVRKYLDCRASGVYPGVHPGFAVLSIPTWAMEKQELRIGEERLAI